MAFYFTLLSCAILALGTAGDPMHRYSVRSSNSSLPVDRIWASLQSLNATHFNATLQNDYALDLNILAWNNLLDAGTEYHTFQLWGPSHGGQGPVHPGPKMVTKQYTNLSSSHFETIPANSKWTGTFNLTEIFDVTEASDYVLSMNGTFSVAQDLSNPQRTEPVEFTTNDLTLKLEPSAANSTAHTKSTRRLPSFPTCPMDDLLALQDSIRFAQAMAVDALNWTQPPDPGHNTVFNYLWRVYFDSEDAKSPVSDVYRGIVRYRFDQPSDVIKWHCDVGIDQWNWCQKTLGLVSFRKQQRGLERSQVTLCRRFFDDVPFSTGCRLPSVSNERPDDKAQVIMRELAHHSQLSGRNIGDFAYTFSECMALARRRTPGRLPEDNAQSYSLFAASIRYLKHPQGICGETAADVGDFTQP